MKRIKVTCAGISRLLMNPMTDETLEELRTKVKKQVRLDRPARDVAAEKIYHDEDGVVGLPALNVYASMIEAARNVKVNFGGAKPRQISTGDSSLLPALFLIEEEFLPFPASCQKEDSWAVDKRRGRLKDGTAVCVVRPRFDKWEFAMTLTVKDKKISDSMVRAIISMAGDSVGVGDFRPGCKGTFGRFSIKSWEVLEEFEDETERLEEAA